MKMPKWELMNYCSAPYEVREYGIRGYLTRVHCPIVDYDIDKFARLRKFIKVYRDDNNRRVGHYIIVVSKSLSADLDTIYIVSDPHGHCLAPWVNTDFWSKRPKLGIVIDPRNLPDKVKATLVEQFGHLI